MEQLRTKAIHSLIFSAFALIVATSFYVASLSLPKPVYEPIGPGNIPRAIVYIIWIFCSVEIVTAARTLLKVPGSSDKPARSVSWAKFAAYLVGFIALIAALESARIPFTFIGAGLFFLTATLSGGFGSNRRILALLASGLIIGFVIEVVFTTLFYVNVPTLF